MTPPADPTRHDSPMNAYDCARFLATIDEHLATAIDEQDDERNHERNDEQNACDIAFDAHRANCSDCALAWESARRLESGARRWIAPDPPAGFKERVLAALLGDLAGDHTGDHGDCAAIRSRLEAWRAGDLDPETAADCANHVERCASCASESRLADRVDAAVAGWSVPLPGPTFAARLMLESDAIRSHRGDHGDVSRGPRTPVAPSTSRRRPPRRMRASLLAAAMLAAAAMLLGVVPRAPRSTTATDSRVEASAPVVPHVDVRGAVFAEARPGSVGSFAGAPRRIERLARSGGNLFHRSLREAKLDGLAADPLTRGALIPVTGGRTR